LLPFNNFYCQTNLKNATFNIFRIETRQTSRHQSSIEGGMLLSWLTSVAEFAPPAAMTLTLVAADTFAVNATPSTTDCCQQHQHSKISRPSTIKRHNNKDKQIWRNLRVVNAFARCQHKSVLVRKPNGNSIHSAVAAKFIALAARTVHNTGIGSESRFLPTPPAWKGGFLSEYCHDVWYEKKLEWCGYATVKNFEDMFHHSTSASASPTRAGGPKVYMNGAERTGERGL